MPQRRTERGADECVLRRDTESDRVAHHRVDVAVLGDVLGLAVVRAERDAARPVFGEERQEGLQVARGRAFPDQQPHACAQPLETLLRRVRLVVGADARRGVGLQRVAEHSRCVAVYVLREIELRELRRSTGDDAREVHHLGEPDHAPSPQQRVEVAGRQLAARRLEVRRRHA